MLNAMLKDFWFGVGVLLLIGAMLAVIGVSECIAAALPAVGAATAQL
jgi:hypothetical protein